MRNSAVFLSFFLMACSGQVKNAPAGDSIVNQPVEPSELCFQLLQGNRNQDTTNLKLQIRGESVNGELNWIPFEKDARKGTLTGTINNNRISAMWHFVQEGMNDSIPVEFKLTGNSLLQKGFTVDPETGRQYTNEATEYTIKYTKVPCKN